MQQLCRDTVEGQSVNDIFYQLDSVTVSPTGSFPLSVQTAMGDAPSAFNNLVEFNSLTKSPNYLSRIDIEYNFCAVFTVQDPQGNFFHQAYFEWSVYWYVEFSAKHYPPKLNQWNAPMQRGAGIGATLGNIIQGAPANAQILRMLTSPQTQSCNDIGDAAEKTLTVKSPNNPNRQESTAW